MFKYATCGLFLSSFLITSCNSHMAVLQQDKYENSVTLNEMRSELADLKYALSHAQVEIQILEEQVQSQDTLIKKSKNTSSSSAIDSKLPQLEKRLILLEQAQEKAQIDLKQLSSHANQTSSCLQQYSTKISELEKTLDHQNKLIHDVGDLKSSLKAFTTSLSKESNDSTYKVRAGDSLEKIAKNHKTSVDALKKANQLSQNKILIGQELIIP